VKWAPNNLCSPLALRPLRTVSGHLSGDRVCGHSGCFDVRTQCCSDAALAHNCHAHAGSVHSCVCQPLFICSAPPCSVTYVPPFLPPAPSRPWPRPPPSVGTYIMPPRLRMPCAPRAASLSARSFIPWPACARTCWKRVLAQPLVAASFVVVHVLQCVANLLDQCVRGSRFGGKSAAPGVHCAHRHSVPALLKLLYTILECIEYTSKLHALTASSMAATHACHARQSAPGADRDHNLPPPPDPAHHDPPLPPPPTRCGRTFTCGRRV